MRLFAALLSTLVRKGSLRVVEANGRTHVFGEPPGNTTPLTIRFTDRMTPFRAAFNPALVLGEAYMDGRMQVEHGDILALATLIGRNTQWDADDTARLALWRPWRRLAWFETLNWRSRRNVAHHYDLSDRLYALFLDDDLQYSCGYFTDQADSLEQAQSAKKAHIAAKLALSPGQTVLDIGCGWGGLALYLHHTAGVDVLGITLSENQLAIANRRAQEAGVADHVRFELIDYRAVTRRFDRIVSVGMFEHVGPSHYRAFFDRCRALLKDDGVMLLHTIARADGPAPTDRWLARYIFPGGYVPAISQIAPAIEDARLWITDMEVLRLHYAHTLQHWYDRAEAAKDDIVALYDERFHRMWQFYLAGAINAFRHDGHMNVQIQLTRRRDAVPLTRDYMARAEAQIRAG
jgi:cyclopropane-fatty-acyl-phospholipid synthase